MEQSDQIINTGLRGVTIASTRISDVDGNAGKLIYRGYLVSDLAKRATFEEICHLLLYEKLPDADELKEFKARLMAERHIPLEMVTALKSRPANALPMDILQAGVSMLANHDTDTVDSSREASLHMAIRLIAKLPIVLAVWERIRTGKNPLEPSSDLDHAANFLYMLTGEVPDTEVAHFLDVALLLHAEHSFNASTFAAREIASTRAHMYAAVAGAVGSLSGELHGGANVRVMQMLLKIGSADAVEGYVSAELDAGRKLFGLGHAVYKTDDPRAHILAPMSEKMGQRIDQPQWYEMSQILEQKGKAAFKARKGIEIYTNVDFYSASLYYAMGIPLDYFTPVFAIARIAGWTAHVIEEQFAGAAEKPMLYRPESDYIGDYCGPEECVFVPIESR
ncbi:MAG: citrate/2-methylcitrate synthase [Planctomycetota bacterium]